jgi:hypothetical protein
MIDVRQNTLLMYPGGCLCAAQQGVPIVQHLATAACQPGLTLSHLCPTNLLDYYLSSSNQPQRGVFYNGP